MSFLLSGLGLKIVGVLAFVAVIGGGLWYMDQRAYDRGYAQAVADQKVATDAAVAKVQAVADYWQKYADGLLTQLQTSEGQYAAEKAALDKILASQTAVACLPADVVNELNNVKSTRSHSR